MQRKLGNAIEKLIRENLAEQKNELLNSIARAFGKNMKVSRATNSGVRVRRTQEELESIASRLLTAVKNNPGETMKVLAAAVGMSAIELCRPQAILKKRKQIRTVGQRSLMRYFPMS